MKPQCPFTPHKPAPIDYFIDRESAINYIRNKFPDISLGNHRNLIIFGNRGSGKTSLAHYIVKKICDDEKFEATHIFMGEVPSIEDFFKKISRQLNSINPNRIKYFSRLLNRIEKIQLFGFLIQVQKQPKNDYESVEDFSKIILKVIKKKSTQKRGLLLIVDDIMDIGMNPKFATWFKNYDEFISTNYKKYPVFMIFIALSELKEQLNKNQPAFLRIFDEIAIENLKNEFVEAFYHNAFTKVNMQWENDAIKIMVDYAQGDPIMMQKIGEAVFFEDNDNFIDFNDAHQGIQKILSVAESIWTIDFH